MQSTSSHTLPPSSTQALKRRSAFALTRLPRWAWSLVGGAIGLFDFGLLIVFDANLTIGEIDATAAIGVFFFVPYALLGWAFGGLAHARERADQDRETISRQLRTIEKAQRALVQEEKLAGIGRLAAGVAHEVRNPLGVIRASASMAQESFDPDTDPHKALSFVCEETDRLDRLVASLLTFAKPQSIECIEVDVAKVLDRSIELARHEALQSKVTLEMDVGANLATIRADPDRLASALYGLALNAIQAVANTRSNDRRVRITAYAMAEAGTLRIEVMDSGPGIAHAMRDQIFEPFVTTKDTGTGLGLPMALRLIEAQGGSLRLADASETQQALEGASFIIEFPMEGCIE